MMKYLFVLVGLLCLQAADFRLGDIADGSRATPLHHIRLFDQDSSVIYPDERPLLPFSTKQSCSSCHNYELIRKGWHFNAGDSTVNDGRNGHPFFWVDRRALLQVPLSYRQWTASFKPQALGIDALRFVSRFGGQMPGGGLAEDSSRWALKNYWRWQVSGAAEVNCFACHDASPLYDAAEYADQMKRQNFRWAASAATDLARVQGSARDMPDYYDLYWGFAPDEPRKKPPTVQYNAQRFDEKGQVTLRLTRHISDERCYACHSLKIMSKGQTATLPHADVHLKAGLHCVDCHRNGLDHQIDRGLEGQTYSCAHCHLKSGEYGAPKPRHGGLPPVHFEKLACTTCHSGPLPGDTTFTVHTSIGHELGTRYARRAARALPHIQAPVFAADRQGKIRPHFLSWPVFWATFQQDTLRPVSLETLKKVVVPLVARQDTLPVPGWPALSDSLLQAALDSLSAVLPDQPIALVAGQTMFFVNKQGALGQKRTPLARPYLWPLAHDVRPAAQSLGAGGCTDCHAPASPFFRGKVQNERLLKTAEAATLAQSAFMGVNRFNAFLFSFSFYFRPLLKILVVALYGLLLAVFLLFALKGIHRLSIVLHQQQE